MSATAYEKLLDILDGGRPATLLSLHDGAHEGTKRLCLSEEDLTGSDCRGSVDPSILIEARLAVETESLRWRESGVGQWLLAEPFFPKPRLIVLGGGHIAVPLVELAAMMGFQVTVCDDRPSFANRARFPKAEEVLCEFFDVCIARLTLTPSTYVAILTRGHKHDLECFRSLAGRNLAYVGMIGSRRRIDGARAQLLAEGIPASAIARLHAPIGLDIGAVGPEEIALSIVAQMVATRRAAKLRGARSESQAALDLEVLRKLGGGGGEGRALITIVGTKGSVPRGIGAKMLVWPDGRSLGSIGGGCSEGEVLVIARDLIREGGYRLHRLDMTGAVAEDEGMVCGGIMDVLIEAL